jgi:hypothetical protein
MNFFECNDNQFYDPSFSKIFHQFQRFLSKIFAALLTLRLIETRALIQVVFSKIWILDRILDIKKKVK